MDAVFFVALFVGIVGALVSAGTHALVVVLAASGIRGQFRAWGNLSEAQQIELVQKLASMPPARRASMATEYMPVREDIASMAASHGIDPGFLYR